MPDVSPVDERRLHTGAKPDDEWVVTSCNGCFNICAIRVRRKDGKILDVVGDPEIASSKGKICGKSKARIVDLYNPDRVLKPLMRTNPEKGIGVDPQWKEISWEEAMDIVVARLKKVHDDDPRKLVINNFDLCNFHIAQAFAAAFGTPNDQFYAVTCGNGLHTIFYLTLGAINSEIDLDYCEHMILCGSQLGHGVNNNPIEGIAGMADARRRGAKLIVIDPICGHAGAKADEWVPILPGTDGALALGMLNVLLNDLGIYDAEFLKKKTNAPYLVGPDGRYVREEGSGKPLVWDAEAGESKPHDASDVSDYALEDTFEVGGVECRPAFDILKQHVKDNYPLDKVSEITTVPADTIHRLAKEFGEAAHIGETREIEGETLPFRPAAIEWKRGISHHKNSWHSCFSLMLLNTVLGNLNAPGGILGTNPHGPFSYWNMFAGRDGMLTTDQHSKLFIGFDSFACFLSPYPPREVKPPEHLNLRELLPVTGFIPTIPIFTIADPEKFRIPYKPEVMITCRTNPMISNPDPKAVAEMLKKLDFIIGFGIKIDETLEFADIILPEAHDFERYWFFPPNAPAGFQKPGPGDWYYQIVQPVLEPPGEVRSWIEVMMEIAERLGLLAEFNDSMNMATGLLMLDNLALEADKRYTTGEICLRLAEMFAWIGDREITPDTFTEKEPALNLGPKSVEEAYANPLNDARAPVYMEHLIDVGERVKEVTHELGMDFWDVSSYNPLPTWTPCPAYEEGGEEYDLFLTSSRLPLHCHSISADNPWVSDVCSRNPLDYNILLNSETAAAKGIEDGDTVCVESKTGKVRGTVCVTECIHPQVVGTLGGHLGQWARHKKIARGKGINHNALIAFDWDLVETVSGQSDSCARVKIYKEGG